MSGYATSFAAIYAVIVIVVIVAHVVVIWLVWKCYSDRRAAIVRQNIAAAQTQVVYTIPAGHAPGGYAQQQVAYPPGQQPAYVYGQQPVVYGAQPQQPQQQMPVYTATPTKS
ncbi:hypothetical protein HDU67_004581 [Dinochytrium kinnereticum]|nr:hypothetical protein HDU67_004581 [Dinochytrium kinnereticum]